MIQFSHPINIQYNSNFALRCSNHTFKKPGAFLLAPNEQTDTYPYGILLDKTSSTHLPKKHIKSKNHIRFISYFQVETYRNQLTNKLNLKKQQHQNSRPLDFSPKLSAPSDCIIMSTLCPSLVIALRTLNRKSGFRVALGNQSWSALDGGKCLYPKVVVFNPEGPMGKNENPINWGYIVIYISL